MVGAVALLHELEHPGDHYSGGDGGHHGAHDGGVQQGDVQEGGGQQEHACHLKAGGDEAHEDGGTAHPFEVVHLEGEAGPGEDDDEGQLPQVGGDAQDGAVQQIEDVGTQQDAGEQHSQEAGQPEPAEDPAQGHADEENEGETGEHGEVPPSFVAQERKKS